MNRISFLLLILVSCVVLPVWAADDLPGEATLTRNVEIKPAAESAKTTVQNPAEKLGRGIVNIITAPLEIAKQVDLGWKESARKNKNPSGAFSGFFKGVTYTLGRMGSGIWDVVSFPFKTPRNYEPLMKPEFVLDNK